MVDRQLVTFPAAAGVRQVSRPDILDNPPDFTQEHVDWMTAQVVALEANFYKVPPESVAHAVSEARGIRVIRDRMLATIENRQGARR